MGTPIYKISEYVDWKSTGIYSGGYGASSVISPPTDLSNYYTIVQLQTSGQSEVHFDNITDAYHNNLLGLEGGP